MGFQLLPQPLVIQPESFQLLGQLVRSGCVFHSLDVATVDEDVVVPLSFEQRILILQLLDGDVHLFHPTLGGNVIAFQGGQSLSQVLDLSILFPDDVFVLGDGFELRFGRHLGARFARIARRNDRLGQRSF